MFELTPWTTPKSIADFDRLLTGVVIAVALFLLLYPIGAGGDLNVILQQNINIIYILFLLSFSFTMMTIKPTIYAGIGTKQSAIKGIFFGAIVGLVMIISMNFKLSTPLASTLSTSEVIAAFYLAFIIPFAEERFFGQTFPYLINRVAKNGWISLVVSSLIFGGFHLFAYGAVSGLIIAAILFRFMATFGNELLKTNTFGLTVHYINNITTVARTFMV